MAQNPSSEGMVSKNSEVVSETSGSIRFSNNDYIAFSDGHMSLIVYKLP